MPDTADPLRRRPLQDRSSQRIDLILDTVGELIDEGGYGSLSPTLIGRRAGMTAPAIYRYFADVHAIVRALAARNLELFLRATAELMTGDFRWQEAIERSVDSYCDLCRTVPGFAWLRLGDRVERHLLSTMESNKHFVARAMTDYFVPRYDTWDRPDLLVRVEIVLELVDALVTRAFDSTVEGDPLFISEAKRIAVRYLEDYLETVPGTPPPHTAPVPSAPTDPSPASP